MLSVEEKSGIQALKRSSGDAKPSNGKIVRGLKSTYKCHDMLNLFAALQIDTDAINGKTSQSKKRPDFLKLMGDGLSGYPADREIPVIPDRYCIYKTIPSGFAAASRFSSILHQPP